MQCVRVYKGDVRVMSGLGKDGELNVCRIRPHDADNVYEYVKVRI